MHVSTFLQSLSIARMMRINLHPFIWINTIDYLLLWTLVIEHADPGHSLMSQRIIWTWKQSQILKIASLFWKKKESMARLYVFFSDSESTRAGCTRLLKHGLMGRTQPNPHRTCTTRVAQQYSNRLHRPYHHQVGHVGPTWNFLRVVWNDQKSVFLQFSLFSVRFD